MKHLRQDRANLERFIEPLGRISAVSDVDGLRVTLQEGGVIISGRPGTAPEMRCYVEANSLENAARLLAKRNAARLSCMTIPDCLT